jgi:hypothetical protein
MRQQHSALPVMITEARENKTPAGNLGRLQIHSSLSCPANVRGVLRTLATSQKSLRN